MKRDDKYEIEERIGDGDWQPVCECLTIDEAKEILRNLRLLEEEDGESRFEKEAK
jgi:hypothetical protein